MTVGRGEKAPDVTWQTVAESTCPMLRHTIHFSPVFLQEEMYIFLYVCMSSYIKTNVVYILNEYTVHKIKSSILST